MKWKELVSNKRLGVENVDEGGKEEGRELEGEYEGVIL